MKDKKEQIIEKIRDEVLDEYNEGSNYKEIKSNLKMFKKDRRKEMKFYSEIDFICAISLAVRKTLEYKQNEGICECGHDKSFHEIDDRGWCIHGLSYSITGGVDGKNKCKCKEFKIK